ncbi:MAG: diaminopimelate decarboxylase family protein, partial [Promethearchaeota archaeon]
MRIAGNPMLVFKKGQLWLGGLQACSLLDQVPAPVYAFFPEKIINNYNTLSQTIREFIPNFKIFYSVKANYLLEILSTLARNTDCGAQIVSAMELKLCLEAGFNESDMIIDGIYHDREIFELVKDHSNLFVIESWASNIKNWQSICFKLDKNVRIGLRIRYSGAGRRLGLDFDDAKIRNDILGHINESDKLMLSMLACHAGSQIMNEGVFTNSCKHLIEIFEFLEDEVEISKPFLLNLGGGFPEPEISNKGRLQRIMNSIKDAILEKHQLNDFIICFEPGRYLVADAGVLISRIDKIFKNPNGDKWALLDVGMDSLSRFSNSHLRFFSLEHVNEPHGTPLSFQGHIPTEQDVLGKKIHFSSKIKEDEHIIITNCGAYSLTFSRRFSFKLPKYVMIEGGKITSCNEPFK